MWNAPEVGREVGVNDFRVAPKQLRFHLDHRLLGISPGTVGILLWWKVGLKNRFQHQPAVMQTRSRKVEMPNGLSLPLAFGMYTLLIGSGRYVSCLSASASSPSHRCTPYVSMSAKY